jgi:P pilus assembly chaperone PapD
MGQFYFLFFTFLFLYLPTFAQLQVYPTHVFLNQRTTSSHLNLKNTTDQTQKYKIDLKFYKMTKAGEFIESHDIKEQTLSLRKNIKFSPQEVTLDPNSQQTVRLMLVDHEKLQAPEYYIHIYFIPNNPPPKKDTTTNNNFSLQGRVAIAIPILFRNGDIKYQPSFDKIKAKLEKNGDLSISGILKSEHQNFFYGQFEVYKIQDSKEEFVASLKGASSYISEKNMNWLIKKSDLDAKQIKILPQDNFKLILRNDPNDLIEFKTEFTFQLKLTQ